MIRLLERIECGVLLHDDVEDLRADERGWLALDALQHGGVVVDVGLTRLVGFLAYELVVLVVTAQVVLDRISGVLDTRARLILVALACMPRSLHNTMI